MLPVSLGCVVFLLCFSTSCVPYVTIFSRLCCVFALFFYVLCTLCYQFLWVVLCFCFVCRRLVYPMLPVSLGCVVFLLCFSTSCVPYVTSPFNLGGNKYCICICYHLEQLTWVQIPLGRGVLDTTLCNKVCRLLAACWWFSAGTLASSTTTNKTDSHDIAKILLKVELNTITLIHSLKYCL